MLARIDTGRIVAERYELSRPLGRGSMGEVWVAHHRSLGEDVALKLLSPPLEGTEVENSSTAVARFRFEAQVAARLSRRTRHIVRVTDNGEEDGLAYLVMELLEGETLASRLARSGPLDLATAAKVVAQIARALTEAHGAGVMHRDLKPANVFLTRDEEGDLLVKVLDFGIARTIPSHRVTPAFATAPGLVFGTPGYMSPEQAFFAEELDHRCDLWALATIAYEALTGDLPVVGASTQELLANLCAGRMVSVHERNPGLPALLAGFFERVFAEKMIDRFASASELAKAFERAIGSEDEARMAPQAAPPGADKGSTVPVALPAGAPRLPRAATAPQTSHRARSRRFVLAAALLVGVVALGTAWRARASRARSTAAPSASIVEAAGAREESANPLPPPPPPQASEEPAAPELRVAAETVRAAPAAPVQTSASPLSNAAPSRATGPSMAAPRAAQRPSSSAPGPSSSPPLVPSASARVPVDPSAIL